MSKLTLLQTVSDIKGRGFLDALIDQCGMWSRLPDDVKNRYKNRYVSRIVWDYDLEEGIVYIEL